jgi:hypothetical protein
MAMRTCRLLALVAVLVVVGSGPLQACGFIGDFTKQVTLREETADAGLVVYGHMEDSRPTDPEQGQGTTKMVIEAIVKNNPFLDGRKVLTIPRYIPITDPKNPPQYLIFADISKGKLDVFRGEVATPATVDYLNGLTKPDGKDRRKLLRYCADYLEHKDPTIAADAFLEFMKSPDKDIGDVAKHLSPKTLRGWLLDEKTTKDRLRLYGYLLGNCGGDEDARLLRGLVERFMKEENPPQVDGLLTGYTLLRPREGWEYVRALMKDSKPPFLIRFACIRSARFFHNTRPDVVSEKDILALMSLALDQPDMADIPIEDLRRWRCWTLTERILALDGKKDYEGPLMERTVARYALACPLPEANRFIEDLRRKNPDLYRDTVELLELEKSGAKSK